MKGLKIIPMFLGLIVLSYIGIMFVEANRDEVSITFGSYQSAPTALGFVVLTSILIGMVVAGLLCSIEMLALYVQNKSLKRRLTSQAPTPKPTRAAPSLEPADVAPNRPAGDLP
jgi:uncharacterized integral membrane protein